MSSIYNTIPESKLRHLYEQRGWSLRDIGRKYDCDTGVIVRAFRKHGIQMRHPTAALSLDADDLRALYRGRKLSTYKIAARYGCDPKTVYRYLKLNSIATRPRKRISLNKKVLSTLYLNKKLSLSEIARQNGYSAPGILKKLRQHGIERRSISETSTKHQKSDFIGGKKEKAYMVGFRVGDLGIRKKKNLIYVSSGTTKVAQSELIQNLFHSYGPVWIGKKDKRGAWNVSSSLNTSFSFLLPKHKHIPKWILKSNSYFFSFLAGYTDAEGNIYISDGRAKFRLRSYDKGILRDIHTSLRSKGIGNLFGLVSNAGTDERGVKHNKDCWSVTINERRAISRLFMILLPLLRHQKRKEDAVAAMANVTNRLPQ
ncbi:hypothetical protein HY969_04915 [Candidatus Kaiserbacteria bacterium]|nr:hypothetical protein [Candidatus Kaiserbacteria bacterium]